MHIKANPETVLIIDDDVQLCGMLRNYFSTCDWCIETAHTGADGLSKAQTMRPDLIILDIMLPDASGLDVLRHLHAFAPYRILLLTARGEDIDRIVGLEMGADDYLGKPFNPRELEARMRALLRRSKGTSLGAQPPLTEFEIQLSQRRILYRKTLMSLTDVEFTVLRCFLERVYQTVTRDELSVLLTGRSAQALDRSVDMNVSRVRKKLRGLDGFKGRIIPVRHLGYMMVLEPEGHL